MIGWLSMSLRKLSHRASVLITSNNLVQPDGHPADSTVKCCFGSCFGSPVLQQFRGQAHLRAPIGGEAKELIASEVSFSNSYLFSACWWTLPTLLVSITFGHPVNCQLSWMRKWGNEARDFAGVSFLPARACVWLCRSEYITLPGSHVVLSCWGYPQIIQWQSSLAINHPL